MAATVLVLVVAAGAALALVLAGDGDEGNGTEDTAVSNTTVQGLAIAPLTGLEVPPERAELLEQPALAVKVDAAPQANGQYGLAEADVVVEAQVEGISRFLAVWHSRRAEEVGPVRSARTTDLDLLPLFGRPLFSYSGGNLGVLAALRDADGFQDVSEAVVPGAYRRERSRRAPHNLLADPEALQAAAEQPFGPPVPLFSYRAPGDPVPGAPAAGVVASAGARATFVWDATVPGWRRWAHGTAQLDADGEQLAPTNVVVLEVDYVPSVADDRSPEAVSTGGGAARVYSDGAVQQGTWARPGRTSVWDLRTAEGAAMTLRPGTTWVVLADRAPEELSAGRAEDLLAGG